MHHFLLIFARFKCHIFQSTVEWRRHFDFERATIWLERVEREKIDGPHECKETHAGKKIWRRQPRI